MEELGTQRVGNGIVEPYNEREYNIGRKSRVFQKRLENLFIVKDQRNVNE